MSSRYEDEVSGIVNWNWIHHFGEEERYPLKYWSYDTSTDQKPKIAPYSQLEARTEVLGV